MELDIQEGSRYFGCRERYGLTGKSAVQLDS